MAANFYFVKILDIDIHLYVNLSTKDSNQTLHSGKKIMENSI